MFVFMKSNISRGSQELFVKYFWTCSYLDWLNTFTKIRSLTSTSGQCPRAMLYYLFGSSFLYPEHKTKLGEFPGAVGCVTCRIASTRITSLGLSLPSVLRANATEFREQVEDEEVSFGDSHEVENRLIRSNISSNHIVFLSLCLFRDLLTKVWWTLKIWHQTSIIRKLNFFVPLTKWVISHIF